MPVLAPLRQKPLLKTQNKALFTRLVSFDPATGKTAMHGYPLDAERWKKPGPSASRQHSEPNVPPA
ncbi:hypothetical protein V6P92_15245 [Dickeya ananatis]